MNSPRNSGTSVDPPTSIWRQWLIKKYVTEWLERHGNLSTQLLRSLICENGELSRQKLQNLYAKVQGSQGESDSTKGQTGQGHMWDRHPRADPESFEANRLRNKLKTEVGDDFNKLAYKVINMIPDADWMEFARTTLKVDKDTERTIRDRSSSSNPSTDMKYRMIEEWEESRKAADQNASAGELLDLAVDFLIRKGKVSRIVQQTFNGTINAQTFNGYVNNQGPQVQASA